MLHVRADQEDPNERKCPTRKIQTLPGGESCQFWLHRRVWTATQMTETRHAPLTSPITLQYSVDGNLHSR